MPLNENMKFNNHNSGILDYPSNKKWRRNTINIFKVKLY